MISSTWELISESAAHIFAAHQYLETGGEGKRYKVISLYYFIIIYIDYSFIQYFIYGISNMSF